MFALLLCLACSSAPPSSWTPLPPPLPVTPGAYEELVLVLESLPEPSDPVVDRMAEQVKEGVTPEDVELSHRDLSALLAAEGIAAPLLALDEDPPEYARLRTLASAAILESRVHLAYGEGGYAWGALAPVLKIAGDLQGAGGGVLPFAVGVHLESTLLTELERVLETPYGLGREGESAMRAFLLQRQARPDLMPYAASTECEAIDAALADPASLEIPTTFYDAKETIALHGDICQAELAMLAKPYRERAPVEVELPDRLIRNRAGIEVLEVVLVSFDGLAQREAALQVQRLVLLTALDLRAGYGEAWPGQGMPTDPATGAPLQWDGVALTGAPGLPELEHTVRPAPPVWSTPETSTAERGGRSSRR